MNKKNVKNYIIYTLFIYFLLLVTIQSKNLFKHYNYDEIIQSFIELSQTCSQYIKIDTSQKRYNLPSIKECGKNKNKSCINLIVFLTDFDTYTLDRPSYYISSSIHGDEVIGAPSLLEFAKYFCNSYDTKKSSLYHNILKTKLIIITPMTNAYGYSNKNREEKIYLKGSNKYIQVDPNRDFPYFNSNENTKNCMRTISGRTINEIFNEFIIQGSITFHGGENVIGYPWGNYIHIIKTNNKKKSTETPDYNAFYHTGLKMVKFSSSESNYNNRIPNYKLGDMTSTVYPLDGALEDWAYGGWEGYEKNNNGINPIKICKPDSFNEYNMFWNLNNGNNSLLNYYDYKLRCLIYLVEASYKKIPDEKDYGINDFDNKDIFNFYETVDFFGHIPRNMRLIYTAVDLISASIYIDIEKIEKITNNNNNDIIEYNIPFLFMGCITLKKYSLHKISFEHMTKDILDKNNLSTKINSSTFSEFNSKNGEKFDCYYNNLTYYNITIISNKNNNNNIIRNLHQLNDPLHHFVRPGGDYDNLSNMGIKMNNLYNKKGNIYIIRGESPDDDWGKQENPEPNVKPQSHVVRSKLDEKYFVKNGNYSLKSNYFFYSNPLIIFDNDEDKKNNLYIIDDIESLFYEDEFNIMKLIINNNSNKKYKIDSQIRFEINNNNDNNKYTILTSEINFDINLKIHINSENDKIIKQKKEIKINSYFLLSNANEIYNLTQINCDNNYGSSDLIIRCNILQRKTGSYIRQNLANSIIGFDLKYENKSFLNFYGLFSFENNYKGKYFVNYYNEINPVENNLMISSSNFPFFIKESKFKINSNLIDDIYFQIFISKISNTKLNLKFNIQINNSKYNSYYFLILFPFCEQVFYIKGNLLEKEINIEEKSEGKILGKIVYIIPIESSDYDKIKNSEKILSNKNNNILNLNMELTGITKKVELYEYIACSIISYNSFRNEVSKNEINKFFSKFSDNLIINYDKKNSLFIIFGFIIGSICIGIIFLIIIRKRIGNYFKYEKFYEEKVVGISNTSDI